MHGLVPNFYTMIIRNMILRCILLVVCVLCASQHAMAGEPQDAEKKAQEPDKDAVDSSDKVADSPAYPIPVERNFNKLRDFYSYDPATDKWSTIEDFDTVEILEDPNDLRAERYLYYEFWAYDMITRYWHKVDIRDHGYKLGKLPTTENWARGAGDDMETPEDTPPEEPSTFWKNWAFGFRVGAGATFFKNILSNCSFTERDGKLFFQDAKGEKEEVAYAPNWFGKPCERIVRFGSGSKGTFSIKKAQIGQEIVFSEWGWHMPVTVFTHYTLFKSFRIGAGSGLVISHLKELVDKTNGFTFEIPKSQQRFYNLNWFGLLGYKVMHSPVYDIVLDVQVGQNYSLGTSLKNAFKEKVNLDNGWLLSGGISYERKLSNYFRWIVRLGSDWRINDGTPGMEGDAFVAFHQIATHLELGMHVSFGEDTEEAEEKAKRELEEKETKKGKRKSARPRGKQGNNKGQGKRPRGGGLKKRAK